MATDEEQARKDARWARNQAESRRSGAKVQLWLVPFWILFAGAQWVWAHSLVVHLLWTGVAAFQLINGYYQWRVLRRPLPPVPGQDEGPGH